MEYFDLIEKRRSVRKYTEEPVTKEEIDRVLYAAHLSASACNSQPWHFTVLLSPEKRALGAKAVGICPPANGFAAVCPALIVLSGDRTPALFPEAARICGVTRFEQIDIGSAAAYLTLAAADLGLGTCIMGMFDEALLREAAGIPDREIPRLVIALGHPADGDRPHVKKRKDTAEVYKVL